MLLVSMTVAAAQRMHQRKGGIVQYIHHVNEGAGGSSLPLLAENGVNVKLEIL